MHVLEADRPDRMEVDCGVFAVLAGEQPVANLATFGLYALQHRGQESAGIAVFNQGKVRLHKDMGLVSQVFDQAVLARMPGDLAIGHNRYSTTGSSRVCNAQPVVLMTRLGAFALAHNVWSSFPSSVWKLLHPSGRWPYRAGTDWRCSDLKALPHR